MKYSGRIQCHAGLNDLIYHALIRAETPALMEPQGLSRDDGKRPDGLTLVPWQSGRSATWDVTVAHTLAPSYVSQNALQAGSRSGRIGERVDQVQYALRHLHILSGDGSDSWSLVRQSSQLHSRNWQKSRALHSRSAGHYVPVPTHFFGNSTFQHIVPCHHSHSFRVPIVTIPDIHFCIC